MKGKQIDNKTPIFQLTVGELLSIIRQEEKPTTNEPKIPEIFGIDTLQKITTYSKASIYAKTSRKEIPHFRRDGRLFFRSEEIMEWLTANPVKTIKDHCQTMDSILTTKRRKG